MKSCARLLRFNCPCRFSVGKVTDGHAGSFRCLIALLFADPKVHGADSGPEECEARANKKPGIAARSPGGTDEDDT